MRVVLEIDMDNAAFEEEGAELSRIFKKLATKAEDMVIEGEGNIIDINGNKTGNWQVFSV